MDGKVYHFWKYPNGEGKDKTWLRPCVSVFNLRMRICSSINLSAVVVARPHGYAGSWYFQTSSGVYYVANLASGFHAFS